MAVGPSGLDGQPISQFTHGLAIDATGVFVYESGVKVRTLKTGQCFDYEFRIYRQADNSIVYAMLYGTDTIVYISSVSAPVPDFIDLYSYGYLYASGDKVTSAAFVTGDHIDTGTATMSGYGFLQGGGCYAFLEGSGSLTYQQTTAICEGIGTLYARSSSDYIRSYFPSLSFCAASFK